MVKCALKYPFECQKSCIAKNLVCQKPHKNLVHKNPAKIFFSYPKIFCISLTKF